MGKGLILLSLMGVFLAYHLYLPLPEGVKSPWRLRALTHGNRAAAAIASILEKVTGKPFAETYDDMASMLNLTVHHNYPELQVQDMSLDSIPVTIYKRRNLTGLFPAVVYMHGGGWVLTNMDIHDDHLTQLALHTNMIIVAVRYRCAPKYPFPIPFEDSVRATAYVLRNGETFGVDVKRVALAGESSGGNLAAAVALRMSQEDPTMVPPIKAQVLVCPVLQAISFNTQSWMDNGAWYLSKELMIFSWAAYLGLDLNAETFSLMAEDSHISPGMQRIYGNYIKKVRGRQVTETYNVELATKLDNLVVEPFLSPLMAHDLSQVPPAYVIVSEFDILRDEGLMYAERLREAGVDTDVWLMEGEAHIKSFDPEELFTNISQFIKQRV